MSDTSGPNPFRLGRGAMQAWSDLSRRSAADSALARGLLRDVLGERPGRVLLVGAHSVDLVVAVGTVADHVTVLARSVPDAEELARAVQELPTVEVMAGSTTSLPVDTAFDAVVALDDLDRVASAEENGPRWGDLLGDCARGVGEGGVLVLGCRNDLGLDTLAAWPRRVGNTDADWDVRAVHDPSRPATGAALARAVEAAGLEVTDLVAVFGSWWQPTIRVRGVDRLPPSLTTLLARLCAGAPTEAADIAPVAVQANRAGVLPQLASGWFVVAGAEPSVAEQAREPILQVIDGGETVTFRSEQGGVVRDSSGGGLPTPVPVGGELLLERLVGACAAHDLMSLRDHLSGYRQWLESRMDERGDLDDLAAAAGFDNLLWGSSPEVLVPRSGERDLQSRLWRSVTDFVRVLQRRGARHPWPAATAPDTMADILGAMAGLEPQSRPAGLTTGGGRFAEDGPESPVLVRLKEENAALRSRATWFERRLNEREKELRTRDAQHAGDLRRLEAAQENLRRALADTQSSLTFRLGATALAPARSARHLVRRLAPKDGD